MAVVLTFAGEKVYCRHLEIATGNVRANDIIVFNAQKVRVETVQRNCPHIENINRVFTMVTARDEEGNLVPIRALGKCKTEVWRQK